MPRKSLAQDETFVLDTEASLLTASKHFLALLDYISTPGLARAQISELSTAKARLH
jgi:hypothetical protein